MFKEKSIHSIRFDFELLPDAAFTPEEIIRSHSISFSSDEDEDYIPHSNSKGSDGSSQDDNSGYSVDGVEPAANEEASDDDSDDQQLSNAASFNWDNGCMGDEATDDDEDALSRYKHVKRGKPFKPADNGKVNLKVRQLFTNLSHVRMVLREFVVQKGFQLKRVKNASTRYTAVCGFEGCT
ncbi:hypothetical protein Dsin_024083 [Dipteronia sinensis]|uniref:Transposase MuDR plant domain-containing protein n=1 Tax=Dipteronia sinensis TaxID=43782 RepID=A0AAE0A4K6_9ROSI|nr:hypothetical protein Dsin_024083 [Dipteronia sinensis]